MQKRLVRCEKSRFLQEDDAWLFVDYQLADIPEALAKAKDKEQAGKYQAALDQMEAAFGVPGEEGGEQPQPQA